MHDTRADPYRAIIFTGEQEQLVAHFSVTQQLGRKPVLHCFCGATMDFNQKGNRKQALRAFHLAHADCLPPGEEP